MKIRIGSMLLLAAMFALTLSVSAFAQLPCGVANQLACQPWDGGGNLFASQNDTNGFGNFATAYQQFTLAKGVSYYDVESFHWVGGYFAPPTQGPIAAWTLTFYDSANGPSQPGNPIATGFFPGTGGETFISNASGFPTYFYSLFFQSFDMTPGTYWASVVPDLGFPPQWGWATGTGTDPGYQCFFSSCGLTGSGFAYAVDGKAIPEPGTMLMLATGVLGLAGTLRRKLL